MAAPLSDVARRLAVLAAGLVVVALVVGAGLLIGSRVGTPRDESAEAGFARDMATHHAQAVEMSFVARDKSSDHELRTLASDIIIDVFATESVVLRAAQIPPNHSSIGVAAAEVYVADAAGRVEIAARTALAAMAEGDNLRTLLAALRRVLKPAPVNTVARRRQIADAIIDRKAYPYA